MSFIIDTKGSNNPKQDRFNSQLVKPSKSLDPGKDVSGYLPSNPLDAFNLLNRTSIGNKSREIYESKCVLKDGEYQTNHGVQPKTVSRRMKKKQREADEGKSAGHGWYDLPATEITPEIKEDLKVFIIRCFQHLA